MKTTNIILILLFSFFTFCEAQKKEKREEEVQKCFSQFAVTSTPQAGVLPSGTYSFQYSCSTQGVYNPSCYEIFSKGKYDGLCDIGYEKIKARCSQQNLIGVCRYVSKENNQAITAVFSNPTDTEEQAKAYCISPQINGVFTSAYKQPTETVDTVGQGIVNLYVCYTSIKY